jgi:hypothetical protein
MISFNKRVVDILVVIMHNSVPIFIVTLQFRQALH